MICGSDPVNKGLAETRARVCMMGLGALQEAWPVGTWVLKLFDSIMARLKVHVPTAANVTGSSSGRRSLKRKQNAMADVDASASQSRELATTPDTSSPGDRSRLIHHRHTSHAEDPQVAGGHQSLGEPDADGCYFTDGLMPLTFAEMDHDLVSSMFAFDESIDRTGVDQGNFFHWLDFASLQGQEPTQHQWSG